MQNYLELSEKEKIDYLRTNGYYYDVQHTKIDIDAMLEKHRAMVDSGYAQRVPNLTPIKVHRHDGHCEFIVTYSLFMAKRVSEIYGNNIGSVDELKQKEFLHQGSMQSFYNCFVANLFLAADFLKKNGYNAKVRVYLASNLIVLFDLLCESGMEVFVMDEHIETDGSPNSDRADYWRFLAFGDESADFTICTDSDEALHVEKINRSRKHTAGDSEYYTWMAAHPTNCIDVVGLCGMTYVHGGLNSVNNKSEFFQKYKMDELLAAYHVLSNEMNFGQIRVYPAIAKSDKSYSVVLSSFSTGLRNLTKYCGDQCFLNSILFFWFADNGKFALCQSQPKPINPALDYYTGYAYPYFIYLYEHGSKIVNPAGEDITLQFVTPKKFDTELCSLFYKYKSDKCPQLQHSYSPQYYAMFAEQRESVKRVLEIGIGTFEAMNHLVGGGYYVGASLRAWRDFFPNAMVYGCDISETALFEDERIKCFITDQSKVSALRKLIDDINRDAGSSELFDLIIDDGSHLPAHMILTAVTLWENVKVGGYYIVEDIDRGHYYKVFEHFNLENSERTYFKGADGWDYLSFKKLA